MQDKLRSVVEKKAEIDRLRANAAQLLSSDATAVDAYMAPVMDGWNDLNSGLRELLDKRRKVLDTCQQYHDVHQGLVTDVEGIAGDLDRTHASTDIPLDIKAATLKVI